MSRKTERVTIAGENRDSGKTFIVTEMDAWSAIRFCARGMLALSQSGTNVPAGTISKAAAGGPEAFAALGLQMFALIPPDVAMPLLEEAKGCITFQPVDTRVGAQPIYDGAMCQIEETTTWAQLLNRAWALHLGFLKAGPPPISE